MHSWAARSRYVRFEAITKGSAPFQGAPSPEPLSKEELVPVQASGWFAVEGRARHYVDVKARFETVGTREHIILGRIYATWFLGLGRWPLDEVGWWYIFFQPAMIRRLCLGHLCVGPWPRLALRVVYASDDETQETVYLTSDDPTTLRRVWNDLLRDCPAGAETMGHHRTWPGDNVMSERIDGLLHMSHFVVLPGVPLQTQNGARSELHSI